MKKMIWLTSIFVFVLIFAVPTVLTLALDMIPDADQPGYNPDKRMSVYGKRMVSQTFRSKRPNLVAIGTSIRNPNLKNKKEIIFELFNENGELVRTSVLNGQNIEDGDFVKFVFPAIPDSADRKYSFVLSSPAAGPEETIEVFYNESPTDTILEYTYDENTHYGGIPIAAFHQPTSKIGLVADVYTNLFSRLLPLGFERK